jgi:hypothetical protein
MIRTALTSTLLALTLATAAQARPAADTETLLSEARAELHGLQGQLGMVTQPRVRLRMTHQILRVEGLLNQVDRTLEGRPVVTVEKAVADVEAQRYDNDKLEVIADLSESGRFTSREISEIVSSCAFDSTKVEALIALHRSAIDPNRYAVALDTLEFTSSRDRTAKALGMDEW